MKKIPYPDKPLKTNEDVRKHFEGLVSVAVSWLQIDGYCFTVHLPGEEAHEKEDCAASIRVKYPYKKFELYVQQDSVTKCLRENLSSPYWLNTEACIFHELIHVILWRGVELAHDRYTRSKEIDDENEFTTDHLTAVIYGLVKSFRKKK